jgi:hypothetical protein
MKSLKEFLTGIPKEVLEYLESNTKLAIVAIDSHKSNFKMNIIYIFLGGLIGFISSFTLTSYQSKSEERIIELSKLLNEKNEPQSDFQKRLNDMNIELYYLRKEIDSLKLDRKL